MKTLRLLVLIPTLLLLTCLPARAQNSSKPVSSDQQTPVSKQFVQACENCGFELEHLRQENQLLSRQVMELQLRLQLEQEASGLWKDKFSLITQALGKSDEALRIANDQLKLDDQIKAAYKLDLSIKDKQIASLKTQRKWALVGGFALGGLTGYAVRGVITF